MTITLRTTKGSELTFQEMDDNFREILDLRRLTIDQVTAGGTADALTADFSRAVVLQDGVMVKVKISQTNTASAPTLNVNSTGAKTIVGLDGGAFGAGALLAGAVLLFSYDSGTDAWMAVTGGESLTFGGQNPSFYLDYNNMNAGTVGESFLPVATTAQRGIARIATSAEVAAATNNDAYVTPATLPDGVNAIAGIQQTVLFSSAAGVSGGTINLSEDQTSFDMLEFIITDEGVQRYTTWSVTRQAINTQATFPSGTSFAITGPKAGSSNSTIIFTLATDLITITGNAQSVRIHAVIGTNF